MGLPDNEGQVFSEARRQLLQLLAEKSFQFGDFKLASGATSDYYIDCRATTLDAEGARLTARVVFDEIRRRWRPQAVGGMSLGADPIVACVAMLSAQTALRRAADRPTAKAVDLFIHGFLVRKAAKEHGTGQRIEGFRAKGARAVIVDDVCTTGESLIVSIQEARNFGFDVVGVMCLVEREDAGGRPAVEQAAAPAPFVSLFKASEIRREHERMKGSKAAQKSGP